jgi:excisionase family DNA binding protein
LTETGKALAVNVDKRLRNKAVGRVDRLTIQPGYLSLSEAAPWAGVSKRTMKRWIKKGLPIYQAGPREKVLIRPADIDAFLTRQQIQVPNLDAMVEDVLTVLKRDPAFTS